MQKTQSKDSTVDEMFKAGAHFGFVRSRRHPSAKPFIFGAKNKFEIFDLEKTETLLNEALEFMKQAGAEGKMVLFIGGKNEAKEAITRGAKSLEMPYVAGRWIGGSLSNFGEIRKRVEKFLSLTQQREKGELSKYTKKERLLIDREIAKLDLFFSGLIPMTKQPDILFIVDPKREHNAAAEAKDRKIPVVAICGSDCNLKDVEYPIVGNDASVSSVAYFVDKAVQAYKEGKASRA
jgi:small subunit ribosomal protein S2